jgi:hypothetical protein
MLLVVTVVAVAGYVIRDFYELRAARREFDRTSAYYEAARVPWTDYVAASQKLAVAEATSLWNSRTTARDHHIARMNRMLQFLQGGTCELNPSEIDRRVVFIRQEIKRCDPNAQIYQRD